MSNDNTPNFPSNADEADAFEMAQENAELDHLEQMENERDYPEDQFMSDAEADADVLASAGMGTDEDYGCYGGSEGDW